MMIEPAQYQHQLLILQQYPYEHRASLIINKMRGSRRFHRISQSYRVDRHQKQNTMLLAVIIKAQSSNISIRRIITIVEEHNYASLRRGY